jgi:hypothetical protein
MCCYKHDHHQVLGPEEEAVECTHFACVTWVVAFHVDGQIPIDEVPDIPGMLLHFAVVLINKTEEVIILARD